MSLQDQASPPGLIETALLASVENAINAALRQDPASLARLAEESGSLVAVEMPLPPVRFYMLVVDDGVQLYHQSDSAADVSVRGGPLDLAAQLLGWKTAPGVIGGPLRIQGDRELLQRLSAIVSELDIDWGGLLAPVFGDELAAQIDHGARTLFSWARNAFSQIGNQFGDYLHFESGLIPSRQALREFGHDVDELRMDADRLEARINQLRRRREQDQQ